MRILNFVLRSKYTGEGIKSPHPDCKPPENISMDSGVYKSINFNFNFYSHTYIMWVFETMLQLHFVIIKKFTNVPSR